MPTRKWGSETFVNTTVAGTQGLPSVALLADGSFIVVWQDGDPATADAAIRGQRFSATGAAIGGELLLFSGAGFDQTAPSVTGLSDGNFYLTWNRQTSATDDDAEAAIFTPAGVAVRSQSFGSTDSAQDEFDGDVAAFKTGGGNVMVWRDNVGTANNNITMAIYDAAGNPVGGQIVVEVGDQFTSLRAPQVSISAAGYILVTYIKYNGGPTSVDAKLFDVTGGLRNPVAVGVSSEEFDPSSAWLSDGSFVIAWATQGGSTIDIYAHVFDAAGNPLTGPFRVNATAGGDQLQLDIAALPGGGFVVAWTDGSQSGLDSSGDAIRLQAFDGSGAKIGAEIVVNTTTSLDQRDVSLAALADGRVAVTWTDVSAGGDIHMQIVDPRDGLVTGTERAETLYGHDAVADEISGGAGNDIMRGLKGNDQLYGGEGNDVGDGGHGDDSLYGSTGNDNLSGRLGDDDLFGESGSDLLNGGAGADLLHGGPGLDTASYAAGGAVNVSLDGSFAATGEAAGDVFIFVEHLQGSNAGSDILRGNGGGNTLSGLGGNDVVQGMAGNDIVYGGLGADNLSGGANNDTFLYNALTEIGDIIQDFATIDQFLFRGTAFANLPAGTLAPTAFQASLTNGAANGNIRFIYETDQTILWFDANGSAGGIVPVMVANLQAGATMTNADIVIF